MWGSRIKLIHFSLGSWVNIGKQITDFHMYFMDYVQLISLTSIPCVYKLSEKIQALLLELHYLRSALVLFSLCF